jgi:hypothetical protein
MSIARNNIPEAPSIGCQSPITEPQLELGFAAAEACRSVGQHPRRQSRASWWFQRMRQIVDLACDWQPVPPARPEQIWFPNTHRTVSLAPPSNAEQQQICE